MEVARIVVRVEEALEGQEVLDCRVREQRLQVRLSAAAGKQRGERAPAAADIARPETHVEALLPLEDKVAVLVAKDLLRRQRRCRPGRALAAAQSKLEWR